MLFLRATAVLKDALPNSSDCHLGQGGQFLRPPPKEFREKMMASLKDNFCEKLEEEPWSDVEATLWCVVQRIILFMEKRMMVKLTNIRHHQVLEGRDRGGGGAKRQSWQCWWARPGEA